MIAFVCAHCASCFSRIYQPAYVGWGTYGIQCNKRCIQMLRYVMSRSSKALETQQIWGRPKAKTTQQRTTFYKRRHGYLSAQKLHFTWRGDHNASKICYICQVWKLAMIPLSFSEKQPQCYECRMTELWSQNPLTAGVVSCHIGFDVSVNNTYR